MLSGHLKVNFTDKLGVFCFEWLVQLTIRSLELSTSLPANFFLSLLQMSNSVIIFDIQVK